jgi:hypothetical protein
MPYMKCVSDVVQKQGNSYVDCDFTTWVEKLQRLGLHYNHITPAEYK